MNVSASSTVPSSYVGASSRGTASASVTTTTTTTATADPNRRYDFTHMTRSEMYDVSGSMWKAGTITLDQMAMLQLAGPLGKVGPNGEFVPFTAAERAAVDAEPRDYLAIARGAIEDIERRGNANDPTSGYVNWKQILSTLTSRNLAR
jgi:hypothetical protein